MPDCTGQTNGQDQTNSGAFSSTPYGNAVNGQNQNLGLVGMQGASQAFPDKATKTVVPPTTMKPAEEMGTDPFKTALRACSLAAETLRLSCQVHTTFCHFLEGRKTNANSSLKTKSEYIQKFIERWMEVLSPRVAFETDDSEMRRMGIQRYRRKFCNGLGRPAGNRKNLG